jgi:predicted CXXCH cytochrome family protein
MTMTQEMHTFYVNWLSLYNQENGTSLTGFNLIDNGNGTYSLDCLSCHSIRGGFTYPDIPMDNAEMCVACHGGAGNYDPGVTRTVRSSIPRILYNPQHLGVTDGSGVQFPPPSNPNYDGPPPEDGDTVSGQTPLPVTFFREFHTNPNTEVHYNYRVEIYGPQFDNFIEADARPLIWYTGIDSTSRWANEKQMYHWDTSSFPGGSYTVDLIPFDTQDPSIEGTPYTLHLELEGSLTPVEMVQQLINLVTSLNLQSGIENSLDAKLDAAEKALSDLQENNDVAAINALQAFINATEAQRGNHILEADTDAFIAAAQEIIAVLSSV